MIKIINKISIAVCFISLLIPYSTERKIGDVLQIGLPLAAISSTYYMDDMDGFKSFLKSYIFTASSTYILKITTQRTRPDGSNNLSFPSGHTSAAFAGASFIDFRYETKYAIPLYLLAAFTGYSRIESKKHYFEDVLAGAGLAIFSSWYFTTPYSKKHSLYLDYDKNLKIVKLNFYKKF